MSGKVSLILILLLGLVLAGWGKCDKEVIREKIPLPEVKSLREGKASIKESYARIQGGEVWLIDSYIAPFKKGSYQNPDPRRKRKLLLNKAEIKRIKSKVEERGYTLVPLRLYFNKRGLAKVEIGVARGKKLYDRREALKKKIQQREIERAMKPYKA